MDLIYFIVKVGDQRLWCLSISMEVRSRASGVCLFHRRPGRPLTSASTSGTWQSGIDKRRERRVRAGGLGVTRGKGRR